MSLRLSTAPTGWLHGRIFAPDIVYASADGVTRLSVEASPALVPAVATWAKVESLPTSIPASGCTPNIGCVQLNPQAAGAHTSVENWRPFYADKASWVRSHWNFSTLGERTPGTTPIGPGVGGSNCLADTTVLHGFVTTNATGYVAGPPEYSAADKSFTYTVASPHFNESGEIIRGTYSLVMRSETAKCFYGATSGSLSAKVSVLQQDGTEQSSQTTVNVADDGKWLRIFASGFHYSSPTIKATLTSAPTNSAAATAWFWPSQNEKFATVPRSTTSSVVSTPAPTATPTTKLRLGRSLTATSLARTAKLSVAKGARVSLSVSGPSRTVCRIVGSAVRATKKGTCRVTVTVRTQSGRKSSRTVALTVS
ncbi:MAG: hypothetical protein ACKOD2_03535 [Ilumatobacteraceae bacterium]